MATKCSDRVLFVLPHPEPSESLDDLRNSFPGIEIKYIRAGTADDGTWGETRLDSTVFANITVLVTLSTLPTNVSDAPDLRLIHFCCSGTNHVATHPFFTNSSIPITTSRGISATPIAEWVIMTALIHNHQYNRLHSFQGRQEWASHDHFCETRDMVGQRVGILGYGAIGRQVGRVAKAMGMDVIAFTARPKITAEDRKDVDFCIPGTGDPDGTIPSRWYSGLDTCSLHEFLSQDLDMLVLCLPLTSQTHGLLSTSEFDILSKRRTFISNISRGPIINTPALIDALNSDIIRGAALDVTDPEPLPERHPLWTAKNVIITPHLSGLTDRYVQRAVGVLKENMGRMIVGEEMVNLVDRRKGY